MQNRISLLFILVLCNFPLFAAPPAPTGLDASDFVNLTRISLSWEHVQGAQVYRVFRSGDNNPDNALSIGITESLIFSDAAQPGESFFYWVRAESSSGSSPLSAPDRGSAGIPSFPFPVGIPIGGAVPGPVNPSTNPVTAAKIYLGKTLFWDEQLSSTRTVACGTCHRFRSGGTDPRSAKDVAASTNPGPDGVFGTADDISGSMGVPSTLANGAYQWDPAFGLRAQVTPRRASSILDIAGTVNGVMWDGKAGFKFDDPDSGKPMFTSGASLEAQALLPLINPVEMGHQGRTLSDVVARLSEVRPLALASAIPASLTRWIGTRRYAELFEEAFGTPAITPARIAMAIASYERTLTPDRTPLDAGFLTGALSRGSNVLGIGACIGCHRTGTFSDAGFRITGVRPAAEDPGRGKISGQSNDMGAFRVPTLRGAGLRQGFQHTGRFASLEEVVDFYNRGGDFKDAPSFAATGPKPLTLTAAQKSDLANFLRVATVDPRLVSEAAPLFDRPLLYSESARVPALTGSGVADDTGRVPEMIALEPPLAGSPRFTVALSNVAAGATAVLVIDRNDPGTSAIPAAGSFLRQQVTTSAATSGQGFASITTSIPTGLVGTTLFGRWYVTTNGQLSVSRAFRMTIFAPSSGIETFLSFSAASLIKGPVARGSIVSGFGTNLAASTITAPAGPLPTTLDSLTVAITDRLGATVNAPLFFVAAGQINYLLPASVADGEADVSILRSGTIIASGKLQVAAVAPGIFAANSDGRDAAAALVQSVRPDGGSSSGGIVTFDADLRRFVPQPINLGGPNDQTFLLLFGTGIRNRTDNSVNATIGGESAEVLFSGAQGQFEGLDQLNIRIPRSLVGRGEVDVILWVDGVRANVVRMNVQ